MFDEESVKRSKTLRKGVCGLAYRMGFESLARENFREIRIKNMEEPTMALDLQVLENIGPGGDFKTVEDQNGNKSALHLSQSAIRTTGQDICYITIPLMMEQNTSKLQYSPASGNTLGRFIRLTNITKKGSFFYDFGIGEDGTLFINGNNSANGPTNNPILKISQQGDVTITGDLTVQGRIFNPGVQTVGGDTNSRLVVSPVLGGKIGMG